MARRALSIRLIVPTALVLVGAFRLAGSAEAPTGDPLPPCTPRPTKVIYINGVWNNAEIAAMASQIALREALLEAGLDRPVGRVYNPGDRWDLDLLEVDIYKEWEKSGNAFTDPVTGEQYRGTNAEREILEAAARNRAMIDKVKERVRASVRGQERVVLVPHSQGNLIVNVAMEELSQEPGMQDALGNVGVVGVATPGADQAPGNSDYITHSRDAVIGLVGDALDSNFSADLGVGVPVNHAFESTYLNDEVTGVINGQRTSLKKALAQKIKAMVQRVETAALPCYANQPIPKAARVMPVFKAMPRAEIVSDTGPARTNPFVKAGSPWPVNRLAETLDEAYDGLYRTRLSVGLPVIRREARIDNAADNHSQYLLLNNAGGHFEVPGRAGFTGAGPCERLLAVGYAECAGEVVTIHAVSPGDGFTGLLDAPYHRFGLLGEYLEVGFGSRQFSAASPTSFPSHHVTIDFGKLDRASPILNSLVAYPYPGQVGIATSWMASEVPHPVPDLNGNQVGYPITLQTSSNGSLQVSDFSLHEPDGKLVEGRLVSDYPEYRVPQGSHAMWVPLRPLAAGTTYRAKAVGTLNGRGVVLDWTFTTVAPSAFGPVFSAPALRPGEVVEATLAGGDVGSALLLPALAPSQASLVSYTYLGPRKVRLARNTTPCGSVCQSGLVNIPVQAYDPVTRAWKTFNLPLE